MSTYEVSVTREGKWWMVSIPELNGLTQARRLAEAELMAKEFIAASLDLEIDEVSVDVQVDEVGSLNDIRRQIELIVRERAEALELERKASQQQAELARALAAQQVPLRDVGTILGVSYQRAHQLVAN